MKLLDTSVAIDHLRGDVAAVDLLKRLVEQDEIVAASEVVRFERQRLLKCFHGGGRIAALRLGRAKIRERASVFRIECDGFLELGDRAR